MTVNFDVSQKAFQAVGQFLQILKQHHDKTSTGDTGTTGMGTSSIPGNAGLLGWAMSSLPLKEAKHLNRVPMLQLVVVCLLLLQSPMLAQLQIMRV